MFDFNQNSISTYSIILSLIGRPKNVLLTKLIAHTSMTVVFTLLPKIRKYAQMWALHGKRLADG